MAYTLELTEMDVRTIRFVGGRYCWSDALYGLESGANEISEPDAWEIREAFEADTEGGHSPFPMLAPGCKLWDKLQRFWDEII